MFNKEKLKSLGFSLILVILFIINMLGNAGYFERNIVLNVKITNDEMSISTVDYNGS